MTLSSLVNGSISASPEEGGSTERSLLLESGREHLSSSRRKSSSSVSTYATVEERENVSLILEDPHAHFSPNCVFDSEAWKGGGFASMADEISNLLKNIVGSGGLSLPAGIAAFANAPSAIIPSIVTIFIMGIANAYSFSLLGRICAITKSHSYSMAWERTVGRRYPQRWVQLFADWVVFGKAILGTWSFSIIIASTCTPLVRYVMEKNNSPWEEVSPEVVLTTITALVLLPLCLSERLGSLSIFSAIGTLGTCVTITTMIVRYFDGSYQEGGSYYDDLTLMQRPRFGTDKGATAFFTSWHSLTLVSILSTGYVAHYNAPRYYYELQDHTTGRFNIVVTVGFLLAAITYVFVSSIGFLTFGDHSMGFILDNYSYRDPMATAARFGVAISVVFAYPLLFHGGRDGLLALVKTNPATTTKLGLRLVTIFLLGTVTALAICVNDLTFVLSFSGATMSALIIYIFPPLMFAALVQNCCCYVTEETEQEVRWGYVMMISGTILGIAGACVSIAKAFF